MGSNVFAGLDLGLNTSREGKAALWYWAESNGVLYLWKKREDGLELAPNATRKRGRGEVGWLKFFQQDQRKFNEIWVAKSLGASHRSLNRYGTEQGASASGDAQSSLSRSEA